MSEGYEVYKRGSLKAKSQMSNNQKSKTGGCASTYQALAYMEADGGPMQ